MYINPSKKYPLVFLFNISNTINERGIYESTRKYWKNINDFQYSTDMIAIGLEKGIAKGVYKIDNWTLSKEKGYEDRYEFTGREDADLSTEFLNMDFSNITGKTGYWKFGNWLAVEFDGKGSFRFKKPSTDKNTYFCLDSDLDKKKQ